jgi:hypothetical protein
MCARSWSLQLNDVGEIFMFSVDRKGFEVMAWRESNRYALRMWEENCSGSLSPSSSSRSPLSCGAV